MINPQLRFNAFITIFSIVTFSNLALSYQPSFIHHPHKYNQNHNIRITQASNQKKQRSPFAFTSSLFVRRKLGETHDHPILDPNPVDQDADEDLNINDKYKMKAKDSTSNSNPDVVVEDDVNGDDWINEIRRNAISSSSSSSGSGSTDFNDYSDSNNEDDDDYGDDDEYDDAGGFDSDANGRSLPSKFDNLRKISIGDDGDDNDWIKSINAQTSRLNDSRDDSLDEYDSFDDDDDENELNQKHVKSSSNDDDDGEDDELKWLTKMRDGAKRSASTSASTSTPPSTQTARFQPETSTPNSRTTQKPKSTTTTFKELIKVWKDSFTQPAVNANFQDFIPKPLDEFGFEIDKDYGDGDGDGQAGKMGGRRRSFGRPAKTKTSSKDYDDEGDGELNNMQSYLTPPQKPEPTTRSKSKSDSNNYNSNYYDEERPRKIVNELISPKQLEEILRPDNVRRRLYNEHGNILSQYGVILHLDVLVCNSNNCTSAGNVNVETSKGRDDFEGNDDDGNEGEDDDEKELTNSQILLTFLQRNSMPYTLLIPSPPFNDNPTNHLKAIKEVLKVNGIDEYFNFKNDNVQHARTTVDKVKVKGFKYSDEMLHPDNIYKLRDAIKSDNDLNPISRGSKKGKGKVIQIPVNDKSSSLLDYDAFYRRLCLHLKRPPSRILSIVGVQKKKNSGFVSEGFAVEFKLQGFWGVVVGFDGCGDDESKEEDDEEVIIPDNVITSLAEISKDYAICDLFADAKSYDAEDEGMFMQTQEFRDTAVNPDGKRGKKGKSKSGDDEDDDEGNSLMKVFRKWRKTSWNDNYGRSDDDDDGIDLDDSGSENESDDSDYDNQPIDKDNE